ncbi:hypothetical protein JCM6294_3065 [Bacteroides pyogenes DSM 20611 = JCM 6294]|uniref:Uncharacterized protein n=1 Tax=Bacteroides pyogenes DSM 20611 = JCM 6294 TaxID=1121100 RepID=W4PJS6_9BACE|nr:hypothetical protein JCM6294_3065 [Bacteroides pyogenes DSM 20611 = JCM 6294]
MGNAGGRYVFETNPVLFRSVAFLAVHVRENLNPPEDYFLYMVYARKVELKVRLIVCRIILILVSWILKQAC